MVKNYSFYLITPKLTNVNLGRQWRPSYVTTWPKFTDEVKRYSEAYSKAPRNSVLRNKIGANFSKEYNTWLRQVEQKHMELKRGRANEMRALLKTLGVRKTVLSGVPGLNRKSPPRSLPVARSPSIPRARRHKGKKSPNLRVALGHVMVKRKTNNLMANINKKRNNIASASAVFPKLKGPARNRQKALIAKLEANLANLRRILSQAP